MRIATVAIAFAVALGTVPPALAQGDMKAFSSKFKPGLYSYKIDMDMGQMPGAPPGMGKQSMNIQHCLTAQDIESGRLGRKDPNEKVDCQIKDMKVSGNSASYKMVCKGEMAMTADNAVTFETNGYRMQTKMAMTQGGQTMNMTHNTEAKYLGACKN